tara:strand:+ start:23178 stop:23627 length:450 start_codon:yes stop_codon:yes gene_type:complete
LKKTRVYLLIFYCLISACSNEKAEYSEIIKTVTKSNHTSTTSYSDIIILPELGCEGCISDVENFLISNSQSLENTFFILTRIRSKKLLRLRVGEDVLNQEHVYLDTENLFESSEIHSIYPIRLVLNQQGDIEEILKKDPSNMSFFNDLH